MIRILSLSLFLVFAALLSAKADDRDMLSVRLEEEVMDFAMSGEMQRVLEEQKSLPPVIVDAITFLTPYEELETDLETRVDKMTVCSPGDYTEYSADTLEQVLEKFEAEPETIVAEPLEIMNDLHMEDSFRAMLSEENNASAIEGVDVKGLFRETKFVSRSELLDLVGLREED